VNHADLTEVELRLLILLANGLTVSEAAAELGMKTQSAKNRLGFAYAKLGVNNRFGAFLELSWLTPPEIR
jgi:DNA-binding CsgD family transcriptional regulator